MSHAFIFPGQGSQFIGMGHDLSDSFPQAKEVFQEVDDALSQNLSQMMFSGDESDLNLTENTQPALMAVSLAVVKVIEKQGNLILAEKLSYVAGHSLGEYAALTAVNALTISDCAKLLKLRGQAMQKAVPVGKGSMAAILGLEFDDVKTIADDAAQGNICEIANDNSNGQVVVSGDIEAIERAATLASERGAKRAVILPVSAPFHCSLMQPAADAMNEALQQTDMQTPDVPVVTNVTADAVNDAERLKALLVDQVTGMVRWRESVTWMKNNGVESMSEIGAGKVLSGLVRRIEHDITCAPVGTPEGIEALLKTL